MDPAASPLFGKMNFQQMVEHMSESVRGANGRMVHTEILTPAERVSAMQDFVMGPKEFRPNTVNQLMPVDPLPAVHASLEEAIQELETELAAFVDCFQGQEGKRIRHPFFGDLDFEQWLALLSKHARHHLRQFGWHQTG